MTFSHSGCGCCSGHSSSDVCPHCCNDPCTCHSKSKECKDCGTSHHGTCSSKDKSCHSGHEKKSSHGGK